jgi:hypothetical protein
LVDLDFQASPALPAAVPIATRIAARSAMKVAVVVANKAAHADVLAAVENARPRSKSKLSCWPHVIT